ncbi:hypothetical protein VPH35_115546 [Triticum aestivum]
MSNQRNQRISLPSQINERELFWNAKVLVSRIWYYRGGTDEGDIMHTDIVVLDKEGTHMHGRIPADLSARVKDILKEGDVYLMKRFACKQSKPTFRAVESPYMMQFTRFSTIDPVVGDEEDFPYCTYNLISFLDIPMPGPHTPRFIDIVAVHSQHQAEPSDTRTVVLQDQAGNEINLVLWGARAHEFEAEEVRAASESGAVIAIFVGALPKQYRGVKGLSGSFACRWYINEDLPEMNAFCASLVEGLPAIASQVTGDQALVPAPVREPPVELSVRELLALDPFNNMKKQFIVKVAITGLGSDNHWWFLSCRKCHKTAYISRRQYRCSDYGCSSVAADPSYCVCTYGSDGADEAEFIFFDRAAKSIVGKPIMTLIYRKYPGFTAALDLAQIGGADVGFPLEISRLVTQKYRLVVTISTKSFQPTSTQLSFQVGRIDETFKPELVSFATAGASCVSGASSSAEGSDIAMSIPTSFATGSSTLVVLPPDELNTPISAFKGKGSVMPKTPSKSPCPKSARRKLCLGPSKSKDTELSASAIKVASATEEGAADGNIVQLGPSDSKDTDLSASAIKVASETDESAIAGNIVQPASVLNVGEGTEGASAEDPKKIFPDPSKFFHGTLLPCRNLDMYIRYVKSMLEGYHADQSFSALLRQHDGLAIGFEGHRLNVLLHVHRIYFVLLYKAGL